MNLSRTNLGVVFPVALFCSAIGIFWVLSERWEQSQRQVFDISTLAEKEAIGTPPRMERELKISFAYKTKIS